MVNMYYDSRYYVFLIVFFLVMVKKIKKKKEGKVKEYFSLEILIFGKV